ncbi:MAG: SusD/RagB family nutrient-binding outer membrane lipoprotein [Bacteroidota bacterium]
MQVAGGVKGTKNGVINQNGTIPRLANQFRNSSNKRIFFAPWETYFLLAEAAEKGWATPVTGKVAYENGVKASFEYWGISSLATSYLASQDFSRTGTSVSWDHVTEPPATYSMNYIDGYTNAAGVATVAYPKNDLYKAGAVKNDHLTKIITQKFIAQTPWLPLETWNDQRRLGLPFFENPAVEVPLVNMPALTAATYMTSNVKFFPQRLRYPSGLKNSNAAGYSQAVGLLGGTDEVLTPLWWAKH